MIPMRGAGRDYQLASEQADGPALGGMTAAEFRRLEREDIRRRPYTVVHPEGGAVGLQAPTFATWAEALAAQKAWNKECPGHRARRRRRPRIRA